MQKAFHDDGGRRRGRNKAAHLQDDRREGLGDGEDANWGRVLCAIGYAGADIDINKVDVSFKSAYGQVDVCVNGAGINFSEEEAAKVLHEKEITILVELNSGDAEAEAFGCDLTYDYVKINGDYRT